jgi:hypothetical protein
MPIIKKIIPVFLVFLISSALSAQDTLRISIVQIQKFMAFQSETARDTFSGLTPGMLYSFIERRHQGITVLEIQGMCFYQADENDTYQRSLDKVVANELLWELWPSVVTQAGARLPDLKAIRYGMLVTGIYGNTEVDFTDSVDEEALQKALYNKLKALKRESFYKIKAPLRTLEIQPFFIARSRTD